MAAKKKIAPPVFNFLNTIEVPVLFNEPIDRPSVYATNLTLQMSAHEVILSFYEAQPPLVAPSDEDLQKTGVRADCVARVTIARGRFESFAAIIHQLAKQSKTVNLAPK